MLGTVCTIVDIVERSGISSPAVIVIGEVVRLHPEYVIDKVNEINEVTKIS